MTWPTSYEALVGRAELKPGVSERLNPLDCLTPIPVGEWVLVTAAAGGVGLAAVQLAKGIHPMIIIAAILKADPIMCILSSGSEGDCSRRFAIQT